MPTSPTSDTNTPAVSAESATRLRVEAVADAGSLARARRGALARHNARLTLPGFRPGHAPEDLLVRAVGADALRAEAAEDAVRATLADIIRERGIRPIAPPRVEIEDGSLRSDGPIRFSAAIEIMPEITLPDYRALARPIAALSEDAEPTDAEVDQAIAALGAHARAGAPNAGGTADNAPPALTPEFIAQFGAFENAAAFRDAVRRGVAREKAEAARQKKRAAIAEALVAAAPVPVPDALVESELAAMVAELAAHVAEAGGALDDYLAQIKKTEDLRHEWRPVAEKRGRLGILLSEIARAEGIAPEPKAVEAAVARLAGEGRKIDRTRARGFAEMLLTHDMVFAALEKPPDAVERGDAAHHWPGQDPTPMQ